MIRSAFRVSLANRLSLTQALFACFAVITIAVLLNSFIGWIFESLIRENISRKSAEIVRVILQQYRPLSRAFDRAAVETAAMNYVHEGYIISVTDEEGATVWNARDCDMQQCMDVIGGITRRMESEFSLDGGLLVREFPLLHARGIVGKVIIETYGPFFYSETEAKFLQSVNRLLLVAALVIIVIGIAVSLALSRSIALPILKAEEAARTIALHYAEGIRKEPPRIRIEENYRTRELASLCRSINELAAELEESERRQKQLSADIAHELRTPLACLQGNIEAMLDGVYPTDREHLESCHGEILRLTRLVRDIGVLSKLEWEKIELHKEEFDLAGLLGDLAEQFRADAAEKGLSLHTDLHECRIEADYDRIKQVFINLLSNAVMYTDRGGIRISLRAAPPGGERPFRCEAVVADSGIGIGPKDAPHIFERFYRSDKSRSRNTGGAGIGLCIAAAVVTAHGGGISVEGNTSGGSIFRVLL